jgi:hypothetical protein
MFVGESNTASGATTFLHLPQGQLAEVTTTSRCGPWTVPTFSDAFFGYHSRQSNHLSHRWAIPLFFLVFSTCFNGVQFRSHIHQKFFD